MKKSSWFSLARLWATLALLLASNLAPTVDGLLVADVAQCFCEEENPELDLRFSRAGERIGQVAIEEDQIINVDVDQVADSSKKSGEWSLQTSCLKFGGIDCELISKFGDSTTLRLSAGSVIGSSLLPGRDDGFSVSVDFVEEGAARAADKNLKVRVDPTQVTFFRSSFPSSVPKKTLNLVALADSPIQMGPFWVRVENSSRNWFFDEGAHGLRGLTIKSVQEEEENLFKVDFEFDPTEFIGAESELSQTNVTQCTLGVFDFVVDEELVAEARGFLPIFVTHKTGEKCPKEVMNF